MTKPLLANISPMKSFRSVLIGLFAAVLCSCTIYQPPSADSNPATIYVIDPGRFPLNLAIVEIDGAKASKASAYGVGRAPDGFYVSPGRHVFKVRFTSGTAVGHMELELTCEAGEYYSLKSVSSGLRFDAWFENRNGEKISVSNNE